MRNFAILLFVPFTILVASSVSFSADEVKSVELYGVQGDVQIFKAEDQTWHPGTLGMKLLPGYRIKTLADSFAEISFDPGKNARMRVDPNSDVVVTLDNDQKVFLVNGAVFTKIMKLEPGRKFEIRTPTAVIGARGTSWGTRTDGESTEAEAFENDVYVRGVDESGESGEEETVLGEGDKMTVDEGGEFSDPEKMTEEDADRWDKGREDFVGETVKEFLESSGEEEGEEEKKEEEEKSAEEEEKAAEEEKTADEENGEGEGEGTSDDKGGYEGDGSGDIGGFGDITNDDPNNYKDGGGGDDGGDDGDDGGSGGGGGTTTEYYAYVCNYGGDSISVIKLNDDPLLDTYSSTIDSSATPSTSLSQPVDIVPSPDGSKVWVVEGNVTTKTVKVIDSTDHSLEATLSLPDIPKQIAFSQSEAFIALKSITTNDIARVGLDTYTINPLIDANGIKWLTGIASIHSGSKAYFVGQSVIGEPKWGYVDMSTYTTTFSGFPKTLTGLPNSTMGYAAISPLGDRLVMVSSDTNNAFIHTLDTSDNSVVNVVAMSQASDSKGIAFTPDNQYAYVANSGTNTVSIIAIATGTLHDTLDSLSFSFWGPSGIAITNDGKYAYVTNSGNNTITVIDIANGNVMKRILQQGAFGLYSPKGICIVGKTVSQTIAKSCNKKQASVGDILTYTLDVHNGETQSMSNVVVTDMMPGAFTYIQGSAFDQDRNAIQTMVEGNKLTFRINSLAVGERQFIKYSVVVNPGVIEGEYVNTATATSTLANGTGYNFNVSKCTVTIIPDPLFDEGTIMGKVFSDGNSNGVQDKGEKGLPFIRLMMEDGTSVVTDKHGKYHIPAVYPTTHLLKIDKSTLPVNSAVTTESTRTIRMTNGLLAKESFGVLVSEKPSEGNIPVPSRPLAPREDNPLPGLFDKFSMVALSEGEAVGYDTEDAAETLKNDGRFKNMVHYDGRVAYNLDAVVKGDYKVTSSLDTERKNRYLFRNLDPDKYYPTYGDDSQTDYSATNTSGDLYLKVAKDRSYGLFGNYRTDLNWPSLAKYDKTLYGGKLNIESKEKTAFKDPIYKAKGFIAEEKNVAAFARFRATGTSLYYLKHNNIVEGSETVSMEVQDRLSSLTVKSVTMTRADYDIDYDRGRIILKKPVQSVHDSGSIISDAINNGNPVHINVAYEYKPETMSNDRNNGGSFSVSPVNGLIVGGTAVEERRDGSDYELKGAGTTLKLNENTQVSFEAARSSKQQLSIWSSNNGGLDFSDTPMGETESGRAYSVSANSKLMDKMPAAAYYKFVDQSFSNTAVVSTQGKETIGGGIGIPVNDKLRLGVREDVQRSLRPELLSVASDQLGRLVYTSTATADYKATEKLDLAGEYRYNRSDDVSSTFYQRDMQALAGKASYKVNDRLSLITRDQITLEGKENNQVSGGFGYKADDKTNVSIMETVGNRGDGTLLGLSRTFNETDEVYMNYDLLDTGTRSVVGDSRKIDDTTRVRRESSKFQGTGPGLDSGYRDTSLYNEEDEAGDGSGDLVSVSKEVKPGSTVTGDYERSQFYNKGYYTTRDAVATGYRSKLSEKLEYSVKGEYWYDKSSNGKDYQIGSYNNVKWLVDQDTTVKAKAYYGITFDDLISSRSAEFGEFVVGLGYRPIDNDRFNALTQYKYLLDQRPPSQYGILNGIKEDRAHIASVEGAYDINRYFQIVEKEAGKVIVDKCASDKLAVAYTNLIVNRLNYHIDDQWNIGTEYRILSEFVTKTHRTGVYVELDRNITKFMQIAVGYNFADFDDELTLNRGYTYQGWTAKLRGKY